MNPGDKVDRLALHDIGTIYNTLLPFLAIYIGLP